MAADEAEDALLTGGFSDVDADVDANADADAASLLRRRNELVNSFSAALAGDEGTGGGAGGDNRPRVLGLPRGFFSLAASFRLGGGEGGGEGGDDCGRRRCCCCCCDFFSWEEEKPFLAALRSSKEELLVAALEVDAAFAFLAVRP